MRPGQLHLALPFAKSQLFRFRFRRTLPLLRVYTNGARSRQNRVPNPELEFWFKMSQLITRMGVVYGRV